MKRIIPMLTLAVLSMPAFAKTVEERLEELEMSRDLNWIKWSGSLETRYDNVNREVGKEYTVLPNGGGLPEKYTVGQYNDRYYRLWANLNMEARPNDRLSFFGRLSTAKYFTVLGSNGQPGTAFSDLSRGQAPSDSSLFLERAFMNYKITDSLTFTMGRLPTIDGPNKHVALNQQLSGNYPTLGYSAILDGFALTHSKKLEDGAAFRSKIIITPASNVNFAGSQALKDSESRKVETTSNFASLIFEYEKNNGSFFRKNLSMFQWLHADSTPFYLDNKTFFPTGSIGGSPGDPAYVTINSDLSVAVDRLVGYTEYEGIFNSSFDVAAQFMYSKTRSRGDLLNCTADTSVACTALGLNGTQGWMTDKDSDDMDGTALALTVRYQTPWKALNRPKVGLEYFTASKQAYVYDAANVNPINMYASSDADVYHAFWNQSFEGGLYLNAGYMYRKQNSVRQSFGIFGKASDADNTDQNVYVSLLATF